MSVTSGGTREARPSTTCGALGVKPSHIYSNFALSPASLRCRAVHSAGPSWV